MNFNKFTSFEKIICVFPTLAASTSLGLCQIHGDREHSRLSISAMLLQWVLYRLGTITSLQRVEPFGVFAEDFALGLLG